MKAKFIFQLSVWSFQCRQL